jgi:hypothetical protein
MQQQHLGTAPLLFQLQRVVHSLQRQLSLLLKQQGVAGGTAAHHLLLLLLLLWVRGAAVAWIMSCPLVGGIAGAAAQHDTVMACSR